MHCSSCGSKCQPQAVFCPNCGRPLPKTTSPLDDITSDLEELESELTGQLDGALGSLDRELDDLLSPLSNTDSLPGEESRRGFSATEGTPLVHPREWATLLHPQADTVNQSANFVLNSPFIILNEQYRARMSEVTFYFWADNGMVNAYATDPSMDTSEDRSGEPPLILFLGGLARVIRLAAAALAAHRCRHEQASGADTSLLADIFSQMGDVVTKSGGFLEAERAERIFQENIFPVMPRGEERFVALTRSYAAAMDMFVVAHEAGHIALGHTLGQAPNYEVSRNQEREADSFAASALSSSPFQEYLFLGQVFVTIIFAWAEHAGGPQQVSTHPASRQRFAHAIESHGKAAQEAADNLGLTEEKLAELLPPEQM